MAAQIENHFRIQFKDEILAATQQSKSVLEGAIRSEMLSGEKSLWDTIGQASVVQVASRLEENVPVETTRGRRGIDTDDFKYVEWFEPRDFPKLMRGAEPGGYIIENVMKAFERKKDEVIINALNGTAYGETSGTSWAFGKNDAGASLSSDLTDMTVPTDIEPDGAVGATPTDLGMNVGKLRRARRQLEALDVDVSQQVWLLLSPKAKYDLFEDNSATSQDFIIDHPYVDAKISHFLGCNVIVSTQLESLTAHGGTQAGGSTGSHYCYMFTGDCAVFGRNRAMETHIDELVTRGHGIQLAVYDNMAATRLYEDRIVRISVDNDAAYTSGT